MAFWTSIPRIEVRFAAPAVGGFFTRGRERDAGSVLNDDAFDAVGDASSEDDAEGSWTARAARRRLDDDGRVGSSRRLPAVGDEGDEGRGGGMTVPRSEYMHPHAVDPGAGAGVRAPDGWRETIREMMSGRMPTVADACGEACVSLPEFEVYVPEMRCRRVRTCVTASRVSCAAGAQLCAAGARRGRSASVAAAAAVATRVARAGRDLAARLRAGAVDQRPEVGDEEKGGEKGGGAGGFGRRVESWMRKLLDGTATRGGGGVESDDDGRGKARGGSIEGGTRRSPSSVNDRLRRLEVNLLAVGLVAIVLLLFSHARGSALRDDEWGSELEELARARRTHRARGGVLFGSRLGVEGAGGQSDEAVGAWEDPAFLGNGGWSGNIFRGGSGRAGRTAGRALVDPEALDDLLRAHAASTPSDGTVGLDGKYFDRNAAETFRANVEREFQTPAQRLSKRKFDDDTKRMMEELTSRIAGRMARSGGAAAAGEHLAGGHARGGSGGGPKSEIEHAEEILDRQVVLGQMANDALVMYLLEHPGCKIEKGLGRTSKEAVKEMCVRFYQKRRREREAREKKAAPLTVAQATRGEQDHDRGFRAATAAGKRASATVRPGGD